MSKTRPEQNAPVKVSRTTRISLLIALIALLFIAMPACATEPAPTTSDQSLETQTSVVGDAEVYETDAAAEQEEDGQDGNPAQEEGTASEEERKAEELAQRSLEEAQKEEPAVTTLLKSFESDTAYLAGLEFRLKSQESLTRKIISDSHEKGLSLEDSAAQIYDVLRYTFVIDDDDYIENTRAVLEALDKKGYTVMRVKNYWANDSNDYKGINTVLTCPNGSHVELQFHTPSSYETKEESHKSYEVIRSENSTEEEKREATERQHELYTHVSQPKGARDFVYETK